jgi:RimJ/RimL family protein N-acetyltransferase
MRPPTTPVELKVEGALWLRILRETDLDQVMTAFKDPALALWNPLTVGPEGLRAATLDYIKLRADWSSGTHASWGIFRMADNDVLGAVAIHRIDVIQSRAEIGYWTSRSARSKGVATTALRAVIDWGFDELGLFRLSLTHAQGNLASCRVAEKVGFQLEGVMRASFVYGDGRRHDEHLHGLLRTDSR